MASVERRHGYVGTSSDDEHCGYHRNYDDEGKKGKSKRKCRRVMLLFMPGLSTFTSELKLNPTRAIKRLCCKLLFYVWCVAVVLSILSLLGFKINPFVEPRQTQGELIESDGDLSLNDNLWSSVIGDVFSDSSGEEEKENGDQDDTEKEEDDIPQQVMTAPVKEGNKVNKKLERQLACEELNCIDLCNKKIKPKCAKSRTCRNDRDKICHRRCRKARCEERCKDEPKFGYVEREQRMDKCKEDCTGPTAVHNKCIKRCHSQFKPCKSRCHEIASKFQCETQPPIRPPIEDSSDSDEVESPQPKPSRSLSAKSKAFDLLEDPEMI